MAENEKSTSKSEIALREEKVLEFWKENKIFEKSLKKYAPNGTYIFYDGPPFATGVPHYGHILGSTAKDVIGRYKTMRGFSVPRRWGWDCHGLPIENIVEQDLKISGKKEIEKLGIANFTEHARSQVLTYVGEWQKTVERMGRWVDFENSFKTMDNTFIESVWWALGELNNKNLLYEGVRVLAYCPRCETPIANSEIAMDNSYKDITDISVYAKFKLLGEENTYLLAWTTTPWTLPGNTAIAVNKNLPYLFIKNSSEYGEETLVIAKDRFEFIKDKFVNPEILKEVNGSELVGLSYEPIFDYYKNSTEAQNENIWKVWHADFVTVEMGTGLAHEAPAFGEEDMELAKEHDIPFIRHIEPNGVFAKEVKDFAGTKVKPKDDHQSTDILVIKHLARQEKLFAKEKIVHPYPHCYRCETPLLYYALPSYFVNIQKVKNDLLKNAKIMNWVPEHLKEGRFKNIVESAPDWTISRNRYWASPLPIWKSKSGKIMFVNSIEDLQKKTKKSGNKYFLMRHGGSESNVTVTVSSKVDNADHLTKEGRKQVLDSVEGLKNKKIDLIISSDFLRTKETAEIVKKELGLSDDSLIFDKRIWELSAGILDGKTWKEYYEDCKEGEQYAYKVEGGESYKDVKLRTSAFLYEIEEKYKEKNILIISHDGPLRALMAGSKGLNDEQASEEITGGITGGATRLANAQVVELSFVPLPHNKDFELDLHRPYIDKIVLIDDKGKEYERIPEVVDCWFESGSMPFAQDHYPFENKEWRKNNFPAGFVAEYIAQTRTWFYYTHVISSILFNHAPFQNVVTTGTLLAEDGSKMSKSRNNFPDPLLIFDKYGVDALRLYLMFNPLMKGQDANFSEKAVQEASSKIIGRLLNVVAFYELYRDNSLELSNYSLKSSNVLDKWILSRLNQLVNEVTNGMEAYDMTMSSKPVEDFIEDLSTWYLRRSRDRIKNGDSDAKQTLYFVLKTVAKLIAPLAPFTAEDIWQILKTQKEEESIHLENWPAKLFGFFYFGKSKALPEMKVVRNVVTLGLEARQKTGIKVRQPLAVLKFKVESGELSSEYLDLIKDELNVKEVLFDSSITNEVELDVNITPGLKEEGDYRELIRGLQAIRKKMGLTPSDIVDISFTTNDTGKQLIQKFETDMKKTVLISNMVFEENDGEEIKVDELVFRAKMEKQNA